MGRGMGRGRGIGLQTSYTASQPTHSVPQTPTSRDEEKEMLKRHLTDLEKQLIEVRKRLEELK